MYQSYIEEFMYVFAMIEKKFLFTGQRKYRKGTT